MSETIFTGFREGESPAPIISMDVDTGEISGPAWDCYQACAAINLDEPVKVAEALPELIEAANMIANPIGDIKMPGGSLVPSEYIERLRDALRLAKAQP